MATILVVDDDEYIRELFEEYLTEVGIDVIDAHDGNQTIEKLKTSKPDMLILDLLMPNMDGYSLIETIRQSDKNVPLIVISGTTDSSAEDKAKNLGANQYLAKPVDANELIDAVQEYIPNLVEAIE